MRDVSALKNALFTRASGRISVYCPQYIFYINSSLQWISVNLINGEFCKADCQEERLNYYYLTKYKFQITPQNVPWETPISTSS